MTLLHFDHNDAFVFASVIIAIWAAFVTLEMIPRARMSEGWKHEAWVTFDAAAWSTGVWSMHFIAMLGMRVDTPIYYDLPLTIISLLLPFIVSRAGFAYALRKEKLTNGEIVALGAVLATSIEIMHFTGIEAMVMPDATMTHNLGDVYASYGIAFVASTVAVWLKFRHPGSVMFRRLAAFPLGLAISSMHFRAMAGMTIFANGGHRHFEWPILGNEGLGLWVVAIAGVILTIGGAVATAPRRTHSL